MSLSQALQDAHAELSQGGPALTIIESIAADYGINPALLQRKFTESYGDPETFKERLDAAATARAEGDAARERQLAEQAEYRRREAIAMADFFRSGRFFATLKATEADRNPY